MEVLNLRSLSHHAHCVVGDHSAAAKIVESLVRLHDIQVKGNPDFHESKHETFTIDDARNLKQTAAMRPVGEGGKKIFVLTLNGITVEAQNALLKLLEEPAEYAHFFLIVPSAHLLLPTVKSRLCFIETKIAKGDSFGGGKEIEALLKSSHAKRLEFVKKLVDDISKEKKTKRDAIEFLDALEAHIYEKNGVKAGGEALRAIDTAKKYANDRAPSIKMLLEYAILSV